MKWKCYAIADDDPRAKKHVLANLSMGAHKHTLTKKLLSHFSEASGAMVAIAFESLDLEKDYLYEYGTYQGGKGLNDVLRGQDIPQRDCPIGGLIILLEKYLRSSRESVVLCENWIATREDLTVWRPRESRILLYGEEVYHVLTSEDASFEAIETTIRESEHHWATGVCCLCERVPQRDIPSEAFFDAIVANTAHIFTPALDEEGYLIWSPTLGQNRAESGTTGADLEQ
jgi:hypothetical protein